MAELERALTVLAAEIDWPATPELAPAVRRRVEERAAPARNWLRPLAIALAVIAVAIGAAMAVPQARTAILRFFHLKGATVERVDKLPPVAPRGSLDLGVPVSLADAEERLGFKVLLPDGQRPDRIYFDDRAGAVNLVYGSPLRPRLLLSEFRDNGFNVLKKVSTMEIPIEQITVKGEPGLWVGGKHAVDFGVIGTRLAGNTLLWEHGPLLLRLEADIPKAEALRIARSVG